MLKTMSGAFIMVLPPYVAGYGTGVEFSSITPPFESNIGAPVWVKFPATYIVEEGAVKLPPDRVKSPFMSRVDAPAVNIPSA